MPRAPAGGSLRSHGLAALLAGLALLGPPAIRAQSPPPAAPGPSPAPPATDVFLVDLTFRSGLLRAGTPTRVTDHAGYDNQPAFSPDGRALFYTSITGANADIRRLDLPGGEATTVAATPESEYSPTPAPGGGLSVVRVEADGTQRLWRLPETGAPAVLLPEIKPVGYHAWADPDTLVLFVLGDPPTLQVADLGTGRAEVVVTNIGRCLRPVPGRRAVSFVRKVSRTEWWLESLELPSRKTTRIALLPEGVEDYAWLPDGRIVAGQGARLLELPPGAKDFREVARFADPAQQGITRVAASPRGDRLAFVSDEAPSSSLTVDEIMRGPELVGYRPTGLRWSGDSKELFFEWRQPGEDEDEPATWSVARDGGEPRRLSDEARGRAPAPACEWDGAHRRCLFVDKDDVVLVDTVARTRRQITRTAAAETSPRFARGETQVTFVRESSLFRVPLSGEGDLVVQLTDAGPRKKEPKLTASQQYVKDEERKLLRHVDEAAARKKREEEKKEKEAPPRFEMAEGQSVPEAALSGDGRHAFLLVAQKAEGARVADVPGYVTESAYPETIESRGYVGDPQERGRLAIFDLEARTRVWAFVDGVTRPEDEAAADAKTDADKKPEPTPAPTREVRWSLPLLSRDGKQAVGVVRAADNKDRWLVLLDPATGKGRVLDRQHDDAWVRDLRAPGFGWVDDDTLWFVSEATGFAHLYTVDTGPEGVSARAVTTGRFEVTDVELSADRRSFYLTTNEVHPGERHLYRVGVSGGPLTRLTTRPGAHLAEVSPDGATAAEVYSNGRTPPEVYLTPSLPGGAARQVTTSTRPAFRARRWTEPPVVCFEARDGVRVPARLYTPESVGAGPDPLRPGVIFIHGAGYLQNAHRYWSQYYREYMFHHLLAARGYVVLDVDYRGSAGYGRDWRTAIAAHMGGKDLADVVDGARYLALEHGVDPRRIGVYGGSYGGFLTLMAMFNSPDTFAAGAALRPVTDWAHYAHGYAANILGEPPPAAEAYRRSSPLYFAEGLKGALLIAHGMVDTNVHFQDSVRLAQRLIELGKEDWELAVYPVENHAFEEATSWADEYKRILKLFETKLRRPAGVGEAR